VQRRAFSKRHGPSVSAVCLLAGHLPHRGLYVYMCVYLCVYVCIYMYITHARARTHAHKHTFIYNIQACGGLSSGCTTCPAGTFSDRYVLVSKKRPIIGQKRPTYIPKETYRYTGIPVQLALSRTGAVSSRARTHSKRTHSIVREHIL